MNELNSHFVVQFLYLSRMRYAFKIVGCYAYSKGKKKNGFDIFTYMYIKGRQGGMY